MAPLEFLGPRALDLRIEGAVGGGHGIPAVNLICSADRGKPCLSAQNNSSLQRICNMEELGDDGADGQQVDEAPSTQHRTAHSRSALSDRRKARTRLKIACDTCRARRTKCDGKRPSCTHCHTRGSECHYQHVAVTPLSR